MFYEYRFPDDISYGSAGGPGFSTVVLTSDSGAEARVGRWSKARRKYDVAYAVKDQTKIATLITFYHAMQGSLHGFRFKDFNDFTTAADGVSAVTNVDQVLGTGDGVTKAFQLAKRYVLGPITRVRTITKPVADTVVVSVNAVNSTAWTLDTTTGILTFTVAPANGAALKWGGQFDVPCRFGEEADQLLQVSIDEYNTHNIESLPIVEIPDGLPIS